uniref:Uncharacterized protein n=1 Tax=Physcomitrium patens TaxID=3218 RepID=A0A2K1IAE4_PHYPA|nr:hypothetical protein PHYPA_030821 [Physcomitrium patens]
MRKRCEQKTSSCYIYDRNVEYMRQEGAEAVVQSKDLSLQLEVWQHPQVPITG